MRSNRVVTVAIVVGGVIALVTFLGAARMTGDETKGVKDSQKIIAPVKSGSKGVVVFGTVDVDNGLGLVPLFPESFPQPSKIKRILVSEGQAVVKGQKLVELDSEFADLTLAEAQAGLLQAEAARARADAAIHMAEQAMEAHQVLIKTTQEAVNGKSLELEAAKQERMELENKLKLVGGGNDPELRIAQKKIDAAERALESEKIKLEGMKTITPVSKREEAAAAMAEAKAAIAKQKIVVDKALYGQRLLVVVAPEDGKIVRSLVTDGMLFGPQTRQPAFLFQPKGALIVRAEVDQEFASRVAKGQDAVIQDDGNVNLKWNGKVIRVSEGFLPKRSGSSGPDGLMLNDTRVLECIVSVDNTDTSTPVRVGQRVKVSIGVE